MYTTREVEGWACHVATRDIAEGEQISTDYLHGIPHLSTFERRKKLVRTGRGVVRLLSRGHE